MSSSATTMLTLCLTASPEPVLHRSGDPIGIRALLATDAALRFQDASGTPRLEVWTADGSSRSGPGWIPDRNPISGQVALDLHGLHLPAGAWSVTLGDCTATLSVTEGATAGRKVEPPSGPLVGQQTRGAAVALAWVPPGGTVPPGGGWDLWSVGMDEPRVSRTAGGTGSVSLEPIRPDPRPDAARNNGALRFALVPVTAIVIAGVLAAGLRSFRQRGLAWLLAASAIAALVATGGALFASQPTLLSTGGPVADPTDSVSQLAALVEALPALSSATHAFSAPEGAEWLTVGPSWLAFLPVVPLAGWMGPVRAQTVGIALGAGLLALGAGLLARRRGARPALAAAAGLLAALAPAIVDEWDAMSLDRSALWAAPFVVLALDRASDGARWGPISAAVALVAGLLGQVYYGLLLLVSAPFFALLRWAPWTPDARPRMHRLALAGVLAAVLAAPVLFTLRAGTAGTAYESKAPFAERVSATTTALSSTEAAEMARSGRRGTGYRAFDLGTARKRVLAAGSMSLTAEELVSPRAWLPGGPWAWPLLLLAIMLAPNRRRAALGTAEVAVLMALSLGPFLHIGGRPGAGLTPWGALAIVIPGFDQLKNVDRAALLAATLAPAVLALGAEGALQRFERRFGVPAGRVALTAIAAWMVLGLGGLRWQSDGPARNGIAIRTQLWPRHPGLEALPPGAVVSLPLDGPVAPGQAVPVLEAGLGLVNPPPFEIPPDATGPWSDDLPLLNRLAILSGDAHGTRPLPPGDPGHDIDVLAQAGVVGVVLHPDRMPGPATAEAAAALLDELLPRVGEAHGAIVWAVPRPGDG